MAPFHALNFFCYSVIQIAARASGMDQNDVFLLIIVGTLALLYFLPSIIAFNRHHANRWPILLVNTVFGTTVIGWFGSLIWAFHAVHKPVNTPVGQQSPGGQSGLNIFANDEKRVHITND